MFPKVGPYFGPIFEATRRAPIMGAHLVRSFLGPENDRTFGGRFLRSWMRFRSRRTDRSHTEAKTIPHAGDGLAEVYCMVPHQLCFAAHQHTESQSRITETLRSRRFYLQSPFGEHSEMVRQGRSESSVPFVSALLLVRFWFGPP